MPAGWAAAAAAAVGAGSAYMQSESADDAAAQQTGAVDRSIREQQRQQTIARQDSIPFLQTGTAANSRLSSLLGLDTRGGGRGPSIAMAGPISRDDFDPQAYLAANADLAANAGDAHFVQDPYSHYLEYGMKEGRQGYKFGDFQQASKEDVEAQQKKLEEQQNKIQQSPLLRKFTAADLEADPVYNAGLKFGLDRGTEGINARATASGMYDSGATLKALTQFGTDYGSTKANEAYNRFTNDQGNTFNKLSSVSGTGQVATGQVNASGMNATNNIGASMEGAGNARAAAIVGGANAWGNAGTNAVNAYGNYQSNKRLDALLAAQNRGGASPYSTGNQQTYYNGYDE